MNEPFAHPLLEKLAAALRAECEKTGTVLPEDFIIDVPRAIYAELAIASNGGRGPDNEVVKLDLNIDQGLTRPLRPEGWLDVQVPWKWLMGPSMSPIQLARRRQGLR